MRALVLFLACARIAPTPPPAAPVAGVSPILPVGTPLVVQLDRELSTGHVSAGDRFRARLVTKIEGVPDDTRVFGTVVEARRGSEDNDAVLRLRIEGMERGACRVSLPARISSAELQTSARPPGEAYRGGALIGGVIGALVARGPGLVSGAGVGLAAGAVKEMRNRQEDAWLAQGALLQLRLTHPMDLRHACEGGSLRARTSTPAARPM